MFNDESNEYIDSYNSPDVENIIARTRIKYPTARFIRDFDSAMSVSNIDRAKEIIVEREQAIKKAKSKLCRPGEYQFTDPIHYFKLSYRYETAKDILVDVINGLESDHE